MKPVSAMLALGALLCAGLPAQARLHVADGTAENARLARFVSEAGDLDGDGIPDFWLTEHGDDDRLRAISGATRQTIYTVEGTFLSLHPIGDVDGDGRRDLVANTNEFGTQLRSGVDGSVIRPKDGPATSCSVGDFNGDGTDDYATIISVPGPIYLIGVQSGIDGAQLILVTNWSSDVYVSGIVPIGDLTGDARTEVALQMIGQPVLLMDLVERVILRQLDWTDSRSGFARAVVPCDVDRDGQIDLAVLAPSYTSSGAVLVFSTTTGELLRVLQADRGIDDDAAAVGDLNVDGATDFVVTTNDGPEYVCGLTGRQLSRWTVGSGYNGSNLTNVGDVDRDGFDDIVIGQPEFTANGMSYAGRWQLISSAILATRETRDNNCYEGPFEPGLGMTRPVIGEALTLAGRNAPLGATGLVLISLGSGSTNLGAEGCTSWIDPASRALLMVTPPATDWTETFLVPPIPQLAGVTFSLQGIYFPTHGPLGFDLTNGIAAKFGY